MMPVEGLLFHTSRCFRFFFVLFLPFFSLTAPSSSTAGSRAAVLLTAGRFLQWVSIGSFRSSSASGFSGSPLCPSALLVARVSRLHHSLFDCTQCRLQASLSCLGPRLACGRRVYLLLAGYSKTRSRVILLLDHVIVPNDT